jgi:hypothetical protein
VPCQVRFPILPVRTGHVTFTIPRLTPGGLLSVRLSPASPGAFPQIRIRLVVPYYDGLPTSVLPPVRSSPVLLGGALRPRVLPPILRLAYAGFWSLLGAFPHEGASHFGVCSGSGLGGFGQGLPGPTHRSPWHPVRGCPCPLRWTLQHGLGGGLLPSHTALCGSPPGTEVNQVDSLNLPVDPCNAHCRLPSP